MADSRAAAASESGSADSPTLRYRSPGTTSGAAPSPAARAPASSGGGDSSNSNDRAGLLKAFFRRQGSRWRRSDDPSSIPERPNGDAVVSMSPFDQQQQTPQQAGSLARLPRHAKRSPYITESHTFEADESEVWRVHEVRGTCVCVCVCV